MKRAAGLLALAGLSLAAILFFRADPRVILQLLALAGPGLVVASLVHAVPMALNALAWQRLFAAPARPAVSLAIAATWIRESINALLPVARIGGEIVAYRLVHRSGAAGSEVASSLAADMAIAVITQAWFALAGLAILLLRQGPTRIVVATTLATLAMAALGFAFIRVQRGGIVARIAAVLNRMLAGRLQFAIAGSSRFDAALGELYARRGAVAACAALQCAGWFAGSAEIWLALHFLGSDRSLLDAVAIEAMIQAIASAAFVVPAALGVQEGGFAILGTMIGLDAPTALALAGARRLRDVIVFFPGLLAWHFAERTPRRAGGTPR